MGSQTQEVGEEAFGWRWALQSDLWVEAMGEESRNREDHEERAGLWEASIDIEAGWCGWNEKTRRNG